MATVTVDQEHVDRARLGEYLEALDEYGGQVGDSPAGAQVTLTVDAGTLAEACALAAQVAGDVLEAEPVGCRVVTAAAARRELGVHPELADLEVGDLLTVNEVAELLGVTRQAVLSRISSGTLPATKVGRDWAVSRAQVKPGRPGRPPRQE
jgi:excisionase family DNA binding protein